MDLIRIGGWQKAMPQDILFLQSEINYTYIHFIEGKVLKVASTLKLLSLRFKVYPNFYRVNRSFLVNMNYMASFDKEKNEIIMTNNNLIPVARRRLAAFKKKFKIKRST
jgi:DNA-binding LytR/AlgR family response regulator